MNRNNLFFIVFINFIIGTIILTAAFYFLLSLPIKKALIGGVGFSLLFDTAYVLEKRIAARKNKEERKEKLSRGDKITIFFIILSGIILALGIHHIAVITLLESFAIASIATILAVLGYVKYVKKSKVDWDGSVAYSTRRFILEAAVAVALGFLAYLSGLNLPKSVAVGLFIFILTQWYYHMLSHKYTFTKIFVVLRLSLVFVAMMIGWMYLVKTGVELSLIVALIFTLMVEVDRRGAEKLTRLMDENERKAMERRAGAVFRPLGLIYGMVVGVMAVNRIYGTAYFAEWLHEMYRLGYIFTVIFEPFLVISSWVGVYSRQKRQKIREK